MQLNTYIHLSSDFSPYYSFFKLTRSTRRCFLRLHSFSTDTSYIVHSSANGIASLIRSDPWCADGMMLKRSIMGKGMDWIKLAQWQDTRDMKMKNMFSLKAKLMTSSLSISLSWRIQLEKKQRCRLVVCGVPFMPVIIFTKIHLFLEKKKGNVDALCDVMTWRHIPEGVGVSASCVKCLSTNLRSNCTLIHHFVEV
jgi:hypothetical protein